MPGPLLAAALLATLANPGLAQQATGTVAGRVTDKGTGQPLASVQVTISPTTRGALTDRDGRYRIENVPAGTVEIRARFIGYAIGVQTIALTGGQEATADFVLTANPVGLEAVVVTASGAEQRARELGNTVTRIDASKTTEEAAPTNLADLLNARAPNVIVLPSGGTTGTGSRVRIRGSTSLSLNNEPIIVVDGIRVDNDATSNSLGVGGQSPSRLNDINPDEIESIEIVKGPSAAALYGTDAANGVIQIRTKRGRPGPTRWTAYGEGGVLNDVTAWPANYTSVTSTGAGCTLTTMAGGGCVIDTVRSFNPLEVNSPFRQGVRQQYGMSASGGNEQTTFFLSGDFEKEKGVYTVNNLRRVSLRANVTNQVSRLMDVQVSTGYASSQLQLPQNDNNALGIVSSGLLGRADTINQGYGFLRPLQVDNIFVGQRIERYTGSLTANFRPWSFLTLRAVAGTDVTNRFDQQTIPPGRVPFNQNTLDGSRNSNRTQVFNYTANFTGTGQYRLSPSIMTTTTAGLQYFKALFTQTTASGRKLVGGTSSLNGVVIPTVGEAIDEAVTLGGYIEEQIALRDRLYLTGALRGDDNSAFGTNFDFIAYPKVSASWVLSEEPFFPQVSFLNSLRLRGAYGRSGRQPGPTDALQFFTPVAVATNNTDSPGITVGNLGNQDLRPEKTSEFEAGLDADFASQRLHFEFTYYNKSSKDALIARRLAPSLGVSTTRFQNLGEVNNKGVELVLTAQILDRPNFGWNITASAWGNKNRLIELGQGISPIIFGLGGASQRMQEGYPLGSYFGRPYTFNDANGDGLISPTEVTVSATEAFQGSPFPTQGGTLTTEVNFLRHWRLYGLLDGRFGNKLDNSTEAFRCGFGICRGRRDPTASLEDQAAAVANVFYGLETGFYQDGGFVKLREVSLTYSAPASLASRIGANSLSFTLTGRNLATWTKYDGVDPELNNSGQSNFNTADFLTQPPVRYFIARVNVTF
ncbi:MAG TPA: TonB-dependent receptor [Gemmatimonadales bacterium]|nr:TonB-dependent receptor [Gemmatimonadales bacterium]